MKLFKRKHLDEKVESAGDGISVVNNTCCHGEYCFKLKGLPKANCSLDYMKTCGRVKRYYDKYKEAGNQLGVGS